MIDNCVLTLKSEKIDTQWQCVLTAVGNMVVLIHLMGREMMSAGDRDHRPRLEPGSHFFFEVPWTSNSYRILIQYKSYSFLLCYSMYLFCNRTLAITAINHFDFLI